MKKFKFLKKLTMYFIVLVMLLVYVPVSAYDSVWDEFSKYNNVKENSKIIADIEINGSGKGTEGLDLAEIFGTKIYIDVNSVVGKNGAAYQGDGFIKFTFANAPDVGDVLFGMWLDLDVSNEDDFKYQFILQPGSTQLNQGEDFYLNFDYSEILDYKVIEELKIFMPGFGNEVVLNNDETKEELYRILDPIKLVYENGVYTISVTAEDIKEIILNNKQQVKELLNKINLKLYPTDSDFEEFFYFIDKIDIFGSEPLFVLKIKPDGSKFGYEYSSEINIDVNKYDLINALDKYAGVWNKNENKDKTDGEFKINVKINGKVIGLTSDYKVNFPELTSDNSENIFDELPTAVYINPDGDNDLYGNTDVNIFINNQKVDLENTPVVVQDRTFVPLREVSNLLGISNDNIFYDEATEGVTVKSDSTELKMQIGSTKAYINGEEREFDVPLFTLNDRTYIPLRFVSEMFGKNVDYTSDTLNGTEILNVMIND